MGRGLRRGRKSLALPYYSQRAVFASLWALFSIISASKFNWRLQPTAARLSDMHVTYIQWDAWGSVHTARIAQQCLHANCLQMIQKKQWPPNSLNLNPPADISCLGSGARRFVKASSEAKHSVWVKSRTGENIGKFSQNKPVQSFRKRLRDYAKAGGGHFEHLL